MNSIEKSIDNARLAAYISKQLYYSFPDDNDVDEDKLYFYINQAENRVFKCFSGIRKKYFNEEGITRFNHLHSDQYCMYIYMLSNSIYNNNGDLTIATKLYYLNKSLHGVDVYFNTQLPEIFLFVHPVGTILGRAKFSDYFVCYQGVTVGCLNDGKFPEFKGPATLYSNSSVLGKSVLGSNVCVAANCTVINKNIPDNTIAVSRETELVMRTSNKGNLLRPPFYYNT